MSSKRKLQRAARKKNKTDDSVRDAVRFNDVIRDTAAVFTCSAEIAADFQEQCDSHCEQLQVDIAFNQVAHEIWRDQKGPGEHIAVLLSELAAERQRHLAVLNEIGQRFAALALDEAPHQHLEPLEHYLDFVQQRLFPNSPSNT